MPTYRRILERNHQWVEDTRRSDPNFFAKLAAEHKPHFLFIGCSDARVPANVITGWAAESSRAGLRRSASRRRFPVSTVPRSSSAWTATGRSVS